MLNPCEEEEDEGIYMCVTKRYMDHPLVDRDTLERGSKMIQGKRDTERWIVSLQDIFITVPLIVEVS